MPYCRFVLFFVALAALLAVVGPAGAAAEAPAFDRWQPIGPEGELVGLGVRPGEPPTVYTVRETELLRRTPGEDAWRAEELEPLPPILFPVLPIGLSLHPRQRDLIYVPEFLYLRQSTDAGATWSTVPTGCAIPLTVAAAPADPERLYLTGGHQTGGCGVANLCIFFRWDGELTCVRQEPELQFPASLAVDAADPDQVYAVERTPPALPALFVSSDGGARWDSSPVPGEPFTVTADPLRPDVVYAGGADGAVWRSDDAGVTWDALPTDALTATVTLLVADPVETERLYAVVAGEVYARSPADGVWRHLDAGFPDGTRVEDLAIDRADPSVLYARTEDRGIWRLHRRLATGPCVPGDETLCLGAGGRFRVRVAWQDFRSRAGRGRAVPRTSDTGAFWFFAEDNLELLVKVLDGRGLNGHFWVFYGALTNVPFTLVVTDTVSGESVGYFNPARRFASRGDVDAFPEPLVEPPAPPSGAAAPPLRTTVEPAPCMPSDTVLCLGAGDRFRAEVTWEDFRGRTGVGTTLPQTDDTGLFWFFKDSNVELAVKVLDGRAVNGHFWVFYGALTNVPFRLTVTDTISGEVRTYVNPPRNFASRGDVGAF